MGATNKNQVISITVFFMNCAVNCPLMEQMKIGLHPLIKHANMYYLTLGTTNKAS